MGMTGNPTLADFGRSLQRADPIDSLRGGVIGDGAPFEGPFGRKQVLYADYVASGRALRQIETFIVEAVLPYYANSHTEASHCGGLMTRLRREARAIIAAHCQADERFAVIFTGSGATAGINKLTGLFGLTGQAEGARRPLVLVGPYEHHSNILPWRESGAEVIEVAEDARGGPDLEHLEDLLARSDPDRPRIGAFSGASNVTGIVTDPDPVTALLKRHGALAIWDYAGGAPYLPMSMRAGTPFEKDAIVFSPHKFIGGPGASGVLIVRKAAVVRTRPVHPGGGTVRFVSPWGHDYSCDIAAREEAGTPNVIGDLRAAMAVMVKDAIGQAFMDARHQELRGRALAVWNRNPNIEILANPRAAHVLPIFSLRVRDHARGGYIHQQLFTRLLSDCHGIQARGGCACAGPYAHRLLGISRERSETLRQAISSGQELEKPGWTRLNLSVLMSNDRADRVIEAVDLLASAPYPMAEAYRCEVATARFIPASGTKLPSQMLPGT